MWIGTEAGLVRFDGLRFKRIKAPVGHSVTLNIQIDPKDNIWVSWYGYPLSVYNPKAQQWHEIEELPNIVEDIRGFKLIDKKYYLIAGKIKALAYLDDNLNIIKVEHPVNSYLSNKTGGLLNIAETEGGLFLLFDNELVKVDLRNKKFTIEKLKYKTNSHFPFINIANKNYLCTFGGVFLIHKNKSLELLSKFQINSYYSHCVAKGTEIFYSFDSQGVKSIDVSSKQETIYRNSDFDKIDFDDTQRIYSTQDSVWAVINETIFVIKQNEMNKISIPQDYRFKREIDGPIHQSHDGNIWFGSDYSGLFKISNLKHKFNSIRSPLNSDKLYRKAVSSGDDLWLGVNEGGITRWDRKRDVWQHYLLNKYTRKQIRAIIKDKNGGIWAGTVNGNLLKYNVKIDGFETVFKSKYPNAQINVMLSDDKYIWTISAEKLHKYNYTDGSDEYLGDIPFQVKAMAFDGNKNFIIGTHEGGVILIDRQGNILKHWQNELTSQNIFSVYQDKYNFIWIGTWGGGLNRLNPKTGEVQVFNVDNGLSDNTIFGIVPGLTNELWLSSYNGLMQFKGCIIESLPCKASVTYFNENDGLQGREFDAESFALLDDGEIYFAGAGGFNLFKPHKFSYNTAAPKMLITDIIIDEEIELFSKTNIVVNYDFNKIVIEFIALDYHDPQSNQYQYRFEGNNKWINLKQPHLELTRLKSGKHRLEIRGSNNDGVWTKQSLKINIKVKPAFYYSWQAIISYVLLLLFISIYWVKRREKYLKAQTQLLEKYVKQRTEQLKQANIAQNKLYSSISHEIKTPLTVMLAPIEEMKADKIINNKRLDTIIRQADDLKHFINNLTNLTSLKTSTEIIFAAHEVAPFIQSLVNDFSHIAQQKNISITFCNTSKVNTSVKSFRRSLNIIMNNLMENAIKQTPNNGKIEILIEQIKQYISIQVKDTGKGVPEQQLQVIFDYGVSNQHENTKSWLHSLGIGLSISQETAKALGGELSVHNRQSGGACFTLKLPVAESGLESLKDHKVLLKSFAPLLETEQQKFIHDNTKSNILIVDDNLCIQSILTEQLHGFYHTHAVGTAELGLEFIQQHHPDLVICDVMLPDQTGYDLLQQIKTDIATDDTIIIMLTAMEEETAKLKSMEFHADAHLNKPYNKKELLLTIQHLLHLKEKNQQKALLQQMCQKQIVSEKSQVKPSIYTQILAVLAQQYSNHHFKAQQMAEEINVSLSSLQRKIKAETHLSLGQIIYNYRINKAKAMLVQGQSVTTVAHNCGFTSSSHFSTKFKSITNLTPKEFVKTHR